LPGKKPNPVVMNKMPFHQQDAVQQGQEICVDNSTTQICALKRGVRKAAVVVIVPQMLSQPRRDAAPLSAAAFPRCVSMCRHSAEPVNPICVAAISRGNIRRTDP
jgi:hypothetical protein